MNRKKIRKRITLLSAVAVSAGVLAMGAGPASAQEGPFLLKVRAGETNYCHLKFPAIRPETLHSGRPVLQSPRGEIVDFYGPCDYDPTGKDAVAQQKSAQRRGSLDK
jgi:hypothetical protein